MRKLLIKRFMLDYICKFYGYIFYTPRALVIICPTIFLLFLSLLFNVNGIGFTWIDISLAFLLAVQLFFTLIYFKFFPVKPYEIKDEEQIYQIEMGIKRGVVIKTIEKESCFKKILNSNTYIENNILNKKFYKSYRIIYHPVVILLISGIITLTYYYTHK